MKNQNANMRKRGKNDLRKEEKIKYSLKATTES